MHAHAHSTHTCAHTCTHTYAQFLLPVWPAGVAFLQQLPAVPQEPCGGWPTNVAAAVLSTHSNMVHSLHRKLDVNHMAPSMNLLFWPAFVLGRAGRHQEAPNPGGSKHIHTRGSTNSHSLTSAQQPHSLTTAAPLRGVCVPHAPAAVARRHVQVGVVH